MRFIHQYQVQAGSTPWGQLVVYAILSSPTSLCSCPPMHLAGVDTAGREARG